MWTEITRPKYERDLLRYASDLTDGEWKVLEPLLPRAKALGRPRTTALCEVVNAILYLLRSGCPWRMLPRDFPPRSTVQRYFYLWRDDGTWAEVNRQLLVAAREAEGRAVRPVGRYHRQSERKNHGKRRYPGLRRRKESQGPQASHPHRHRRPAGRGRGPRRRDPGPRRRAGGVRRHPPPLSPPAPRLRRRRLCRAQARGRTEADRPLVAGDRQPSRGREGLPTPAPPMGRRAHARLAQSKPAAGQGLRDGHRDRRGLDLPRQHPAPHAPPRKSLKTLDSFRVGLLEIGVDCGVWRVGPGCSGPPRRAAWTVRLSITGAMDSSVMYLLETAPLIVLLEGPDATLRCEVVSAPSILLYHVE